ncbi:uncharacterized protein LOC124137163 [Haliotis rufescens]|uniref:uncharacterized protein LOC124137163 n=1 Tax=Haliotis rufescens TaxID=6454 RepID=UPI00201E7C24|nr:uncharacterized protein LOC124137163 [Haliotis rufescens]
MDAEAKEASEVVKVKEEEEDADEGNEAGTGSTVTEVDGQDSLTEVGAAEGKHAVAVVAEDSTMHTAVEEVATVGCSGEDAMAHTGSEDIVTVDTVGDDVMTVDTGGEDTTTVDTVGEDSLMIDTAQEEDPKDMEEKMEEDPGEEAVESAVSDDVNLVPSADAAVDIESVNTSPDAEMLQEEDHLVPASEDESRAITLSQDSGEGQSGAITLNQDSGEGQSGAITLHQDSGEGQSGPITLNQDSQEEQSGAITLHQDSGEGQTETITLPQEGEASLSEQTEPETITISLEEATQIFLQQQGIEGAVQIAPGTYIQVTGDGTLGPAMGGTGDPLQVIATGNGDLVGYSLHPGTGEEDHGMVTEVGGQFIRIEKSNIDSEDLSSDAHGAMTVVKEEHDVREEASVVDNQADGHLAQATSQCQIITTPEGQFTLSQGHYVRDADGTVAAGTDGLSSNPQLVQVGEGQLMAVAQGHAGQLTTVSDSQLTSQSAVPFSSHSGTVFTTSGNQIIVSSGGHISVSSGGQIAVSDGHLSSGNTVQYSLLNTGTPVSEGSLLSGQTSVKLCKTEVKSPPRQPDLNSPIMVGDKTEVVIGGKKCVLMMNPETKQICAYPLLPPPGKKKRGRPRKPKPGEDGYLPPNLDGSVGFDPGDDSQRDQTSSAAEGLLELSNAGPDGVRRSGRMRKKTRVLDDYDVLEVSGSDDESPQDDYEADPEITITGMKKRKLAPQIPTIPMAITGLKRGRGRPRRYPPPGQSSTPNSIPAVIIPTANGQTLMMAPIQGIGSLQALQNQAKTLQKIEPKPAESTEAALAISDGTLITQTPAKLSSNVTPIALDSSNNSILDSSNILINPLHDDGGDSDNEDIDTIEKPVSVDEEGNDGGGQATIIQIPENVLSMFVQKKDPIKIGIKASETDLERLKCPKCDFQGCYPQQYQDHIAQHGDDIHKCKCCNYLTFDKDDLFTHFRDTHPRCICSICDFMAEHAYIIKRHMMRHNAQGCTCDLCGKVYKDQYILKMHIKMVHMPAEVLFECTVCSKKFTRKAHLKRHLRIHDPEKPFKCPHCEYRGCERSDISKHLLIHQDPKHVCEVCGKAFRHVKNKELHVKRHNGQRDYKCGVCDFYGYTFTDIRKHIERKHADIKTLVCDKCGSAFKSEALLRDHQKDTCEVLMIEQALAIATSSGGTSQATIQIPSTLSVDGKHITIDGQQIAVDDGQHITIDGQQIAVDGSQVNITVEQVMTDDEEDLTLTEDQVVDGRIAVSEAQVVDSGQVMSEVIHIQRQEEEMEESEMESEGIMTMAE